MNGEAVYRTAPATPGLLNRLCHSDKEHSKSQRASKLDQWLKSYGHFTEGVDFAYWCSFIGGGSAPAACAAGLFIQIQTHSCTQIQNCPMANTNHPLLQILQTSYKEIPWEGMISVSEDASEEGRI